MLYILYKKSTLAPLEGKHPEPTEPDGANESNTRKTVGATRGGVLLGVSFEWLQSLESWSQRSQRKRDSKA